MTDAVDHRRATAARNLGAILDAAEALLTRHAPASIAAVAAEAGLSRVTLYAHFPTREALLEAVVERAVRRCLAAMDAGDPATGPADEALERLLATGWAELDRNAAIAQAAAVELSHEALRGAHDALAERVGALVERGRAEGVFRDDVPAGWLVSCCLSLVHAAGDDVRAGRMTSAEALPALTLTIRDAFSG